MEIQMSLSVIFSNQWVLFLSTLVLVTVVLYGLHVSLQKRQQAKSQAQKLPLQLILLLCSVIAIVVIILALPVSESSRNQVLALLGIVLSGLIAFSSASIVGNLMAGLVIRFNRPFRTGDYIICEHISGRVTEKGILDTEIQTEQRTLFSVANSFLINHPVEVVRSSGTLITTELSLGYDVHHEVVSTHLKEAAIATGLSDAFTHVTQLNDFSVSYKVFGFLEDTKSILTTRSKLLRNILDILHANEIEILSPNFIAQRPTAAEAKYMAKLKVAKKAHLTEETNQEDIAFDKAEEAEKQEHKLSLAQSKLASLQEALKSADESQKQALKDDIEAAQIKISDLSKPLAKD